MNQPLVEFTHDNIPALPDTPEAPALDTGQPAQPAQPSGFTGQQPSPAHGIPMFENVPKRDAEGNFRMVEYVSIKTPGDNKAMPRHKVTDRLREMYRPYYDAWRAGIETTPQGTPLEAWPAVDRGVADAMKVLNIFTVEQLAEVADANIHRLPMGRTWKNRAIEWLKTKGRADAVDILAREKQELRDGMDGLETQNLQLQEQLRQEQEARERLTARLDAFEAAGPAPAPPEQTATDLGTALDNAIDEIAEKDSGSDQKPAAKTKGGKKE